MVDAEHFSGQLQPRQRFEIELRLSGLKRRTKGLWDKAVQSMVRKMLVTYATSSGLN